MLVTFETEPMEYSDSLRDEGFERLLKEEVSIPCKENGWEIFSKTLDCEVWRKADPQYKFGAVKGLLTFRGIPPAAVKDILVDMELWNVWDARAPIVDVMETHTHYKAVHWQVKFPFCVKPREMLHKIFCRDGKDRLTSYILYQDIDHPLKPLDDSVTRMTTHFLGVIVRPHAIFPNSTALTLVMHVDIKGWLPQLMGNRYLAKAPKSWHSLLTDYFWNVYSKHRMSDMKTAAKGIEADEGEVDAAAAQKSCEIRELAELEVKDALLNQGVLVETTRKEVLVFPDKNRLIVENICEEIYKLTNELEALQDREEADDKGVEYYSETIIMKLQELEKELQLAITRMVMENFKNPLIPLNALLQATLDTDGVDCYHAKSAEFEMHANMMAYTATYMATCKPWMNSLSDSETVEEICHTSKLVKELAKQTLCASSLVFTNQSDQEAKGSFQALKEDYQEKVEILTEMVDITVSRIEFLRLADDVVKTELETAAEQTRIGEDASEAFSCVTHAANIAKRVVAVIKIEASTCQDESYRETLELQSASLTEAIATMFITAQTAIIQTNNEEVQEEFEASAHTLMTAIHKLFEMVKLHYYVADSTDSGTQSEDTTKEPNIEEILNGPIEIAALQLEQDAKQWESKNNGMVEAATKMATLMMLMGRYTRDEGEVGSKKDIIELARKIATESENVVEFSLKVAEVCTNGTLRKALYEVVSKLKMICTQLRIITSVKDSQTPGPGKDEIAIEMLTENAENLMSAVSEALYVSESATIRVPIKERNNLGLKWVKALPNT